jgi:hypothetical protein
MLPLINQPLETAVPRVTALVWMFDLILTRLKAADDDAETLHPGDEEGSVDTTGEGSVDTLFYEHAEDDHVVPLYTWANPRPWANPLPHYPSVVVISDEKMSDEQTMVFSDEEDSSDDDPASDDRYVATPITDNYGESECVFV